MRKMEEIEENKGKQDEYESGRGKINNEKKKKKQ